MGGRRIDRARVWRRCGGVVRHRIGSRDHSKGSARIGRGRASARARAASRGGRPGIEQVQPGLTEALLILIEPITRGDPMSPLRWTCKSKAKLAGALTAQGGP